MPPTMVMVEVASPVPPRGPVMTTTSAPAAGIDDDILDIEGRDLEIGVRCQHRGSGADMPFSILMPTWSATALAGGKKTVIRLMLKVSAAVEPVTFITL